MSEYLMQPLPFDEAIKFFESKVPMPSNRYTDIWQIQHSHTFTVARSAGFDILGDVQAEISKALRDGTTFADFKKLLIPTLEKKGWFKELGIDKKRKQARRLKVIYNTNMRTAFAAGHWGQAEQVQNDTGSPIYLEYMAILDSRTRPQHRAWDNIILPMDNKFWHHHYPPNGWNCRCIAISHTKTGLQAQGLRETKNPPTRQAVPVTVKGRGTIEVTKGIDPPFDYNVGGGYDKQMRIFGARKWDAKPHELAIQAIESTVGSKAFERFVKRGQFNTEYMPVGYIPKSLQADIEAKTGLVYISGATAAKQRRNHSDLTPADYKVIQQVVDRGKIKSTTKESVFVGFGEAQGRWWRIAWKTVSDEVWFLSLTKTKQRRVKLQVGEKWIQE